MEKNRKQSKVGRLIWLSLIAIPFIIAYFFTNHKKEPVTPQSIYEREFSVPAMMLKTTGTDALTEYNRRGFQAFAEYKFDLAIQLLDTIGTEYDPSTQSQILLAQAISYVETQSYEQATSYFLFLKEKFPHMTATANWYLALSYLKQDDVNQAKALFKRIPTSSSYFQRAKEIQASI